MGKSRRLRVLVVVGTRPEVIKMAPVVRQLQQQTDVFVPRLCVTAQHREMVDQMLAAFRLQPDIDLDVMTPRQTLARTTGRVLERMTRVLEAERPDWLVVQGDTTTAMASALAAFYLRVPIAHVEAGLRTWNRFHPFPEEVNRRVVAAVADVHFAPTESAADNLRREGFADSSIVVTGNTAIDTLLDAVARDAPSSIDALLERLKTRRIVVVTAHRRESFGAPLRRICGAIRGVAREFHDDVHFVYPVHLNPNVRAVVRREIGGLPNVTLLKPLDYFAFVKLLRSAYAIMTDSGGIQEEAPSLRKPVLVLRAVTERPEAVEAGTSRVVGTSTDSVRAELVRLLKDQAAYDGMVNRRNPFGDGHAAERIVADLAKRGRPTP